MHFFYRIEPFDTLRILYSSPESFPTGASTYIVMFTDVFYTLLRLAVIIMLFMTAFTLGFHCLLAEQV